MAAVPAVGPAVPADVARQPHRRAPFRQRAAARLADDGRGGTGRRGGFGGGADIELEAAERLRGLGREQRPASGNPDQERQSRPADQVRADDQRVGRAVELEKLRSEENTSELQSLMRISYAVFCLKK